MYHYSEYPRSSEEIKYWLERRNWYDRFKINVQSYLPENRTEDALSGLFDLDTISGAFIWAKTSEGIEYWAQREYEFLRWYYGQWIDFHLTK